ncbi:caspase family protein [Anabaena sp. UHCC 0399]|uniref:caspase family protein n=1 Tax=Anabaena sp. UHCC 0399 TaxID=3110238 RepID=UPI002B2166B0|nr:caspase family protein [Anabaena sp. UHCC 0399]MEA5566660.1 caspase family protein [Anabaena sp. UHCC 0399]
MGKNWAIVVGINNYDNLQPLKYAKRDAEAMQAWFKEEALFDQVFLFTEDSPQIPTNPPISTQPTQGRFKRFLNAQFEEPLLKPEDNLWFFFAGHGKRFIDQDYLMFLDSDPTDYTTAISVDYVTQRLRRCGADNVVLLIDACRDEGDRSGLGMGMQEHKGVITFYSCTANQKSWEIDELQHGSFTYSLLEGLRLKGEANCATVERLEHYLRYRVPQLTTYYKKSQQNPCLKAEPPYKMYYILLEQGARVKDIEPLKYQALLAETEGDLLLSKQLWVRVLAVSRGDWDAVEAIERIAIRQRESPDPIIKTLPSIPASGGRSTDKSPMNNQAEHEQNLTHYHQKEQAIITQQQGINRKQLEEWQNQLIQSQHLNLAQKFRNHILQINEKYFIEYLIKRPNYRIFKDILAGVSLVTLVVLSGINAFFLTLLIQATQLAERNMWKDAVIKAAKIPSYTLLTNKSHQLIDQWSIKLLQQATEKYSKEGKLKEAIGMIDVIPISSTSSRESQSRIKQWNKEYQINLNAKNAATTAIKEKRWQDAINAANKVTTPYWENQVAWILEEAHRQITEIQSTSDNNREPIRSLW